MNQFMHKNNRNSAESKEIDSPAKTK